MQRLPREKKARAILLMNCDRVALAIAVLTASAVLGLSLFYAEVQGFEAAFRVAVAFLVTYVVVFQVFRFVQRTAGSELSAFEEARLAQEAAARAAEAKAAGENPPGET